MAGDFNNIFKISERSLLQKRLTKAFFLKNFDLTAAEKKVLNGIDHMEWLASIKPVTSNINAVVNNEYAFEEIQIIVCRLLQGTNGKMDLAGTTVPALIQKYIPYQMVLVFEDETHFVVNVCDKRINQNDRSKRTIEKHITTPPISKLYKKEADERFYEALDYTNVDKTNMERLYAAYVNAVIQYKTAVVTGDYAARPSQRSSDDLNRLLEIEELEKEIISLKSQIKKENQLNKKVALNVKMQQTKKDIENIKLELASNT